MEEYLFIVFRGNPDQLDTVTIAYLMKSQNLSLKEAYELVKLKRPYIQPNIGFFQQLIDYETQLFGAEKASISLTDYKALMKKENDVNFSLHFKGGYQIISKKHE